MDRLVWRNWWDRKQGLVIPVQTSPNTGSLGYRITEIPQSYLIFGGVICSRSSLWRGRSLEADFGHVRRSRELLQRHAS